MDWDFIDTLAGELLPGQVVRTVNMREIWRYVESNRHFADWIKYRIRQFRLVQGVDYVVERGTNWLGRPTAEYHLRPDKARQLVMRERSGRLREIQAYYRSLESQSNGARPPVSATPQAQPARYFTLDLNDLNGSLNQLNAQLATRVAVPPSTNAMWGAPPVPQSRPTDTPWPAPGSYAPPPAERQASAAGQQAAIDEDATINIPSVTARPRVRNLS